MDKINFSVNGVKCCVGSEVDSDTTLNDYVRNNLNFLGTKFMCKQGTCGACIVAVTAKDHNGHSRTFSVNSCLVSITSCQDWEIKTIEGLGNRKKGYHSIQRTLAEYNGSQCGYCSPAWVMSMHCLLESNNYDLTEAEIENSFGSNTCRCTGYRPILSALKSYAKDSPKPNVVDIEDTKICKGKDNCSKTCDENWCIVNKSDVEPEKKKILLKDKRVWYRVNDINGIFDVLANEGAESYRLVAGNTGRGARPILIMPRVLIDISTIKDLKVSYIDQNLVVGAGTTLTDLMTLFLNTSKKYQEFEYLEKLYEHLDLVAHIPVRNIGTIAGNLMVKHRDPEFSSDIFLLLETVGALLTIVGKSGIEEVTPDTFLRSDMKGKLITLVKIPPLSKCCKFVSFKIMPRFQNSHAQVNGGFLYKFSSEDFLTIQDARIVYGGISGSFVHARHTENFLVGQQIFTNEVLQKALHILHDEINPVYLPADTCPEYRRKCALGLFYKGLLQLIPKQILNPRYWSGARNFRRTRPISKGSEVYDTNPIIWPITEPSPKAEALIQCAGESTYTNDLPLRPREVYCAFVPAEIAAGEIDSIDPSPALKIPGVLEFFSAKDIPGTNSYFYPDLPLITQSEFVFSDGEIKYFNQAIGVIVAETEALANRAALLVKVTYKNVKKPLLTIEDVIKKDPSRVSVFFILPARDRGTNTQHVVKCCYNTHAQWHHPMETLHANSRPSDFGVEVTSSTQWPDGVQLAVARVLNLPFNRVKINIPRLGGGYGGKISPSLPIAATCALVSHLMNRPCRFVLNVQSHTRIIGKRLPTTNIAEIGVDNHGVIQYMELHFYNDNGYSKAEPLSAFVVSGLKNCYDNRRWQYKLFDVLTDTPSNTFMRSPGTFESIGHTENMMEQISYEINQDPVQVRMRNLNPEYEDVADVIKTLLTDSEYYKRREEIEKFNKYNRWKKRGLRVAFMSWPAPLLAGWHVTLSVFHGDGTVSVRHGGVDMGQGLNTKVIQTAAYTLKIPTTKILVETTDSIATPNSYATGGTRTTEGVYYGVIKCCQILLDRLEPVRATAVDQSWESLIAAAFNQGVNLQTNYFVNTSDINSYRCAGAVAAEVEVDILTGELEIKRVDIVEDVGSSINPEIDIGQIEGAFVMGLGFYILEDIKTDPKTGEIHADRPWYYHVPLAKDIPINFRVNLRRNSFNPLGTLGARAICEPPTCLSVSVPLAIREALVSSREESGYPRNVWFNVDPPYGLENNLLKSEVKLEEYIFK